MKIILKQHRGNFWFGKSPKLNRVLIVDNGEISKNSFYIPYESECFPILTSYIKFTKRMKLKTRGV